VFDFHHVGIGTTRYEDAIAVYRRLGYRLAVNVDDAGLDVRVAFLRRAGSPWIEILGPLGPGGPLDSYIRRRLLPSPYHTCYAVAQLAPALGELTALGFRAVSQPQPAVALGGALVVFAYHASVGLVELAERPPELPEGEPA
jgi:methylmalonyl-CoA/ethylmalonyl-CoA epimerase